MDINDSNKYGQIADKISAGISGTTELGLGVINLAKINGLSEQQQSALDNKNMVGYGNYGSFNQAMQDYDFLNYNPSLDFDTVRGMTTEQKLGSVLSASATGALTGLTVGGPWGALAGGVIGLGAGAAGWALGDNAANNAIKQYGIDSQLAATSGKLRADSGLDRLNQQQYNMRIGRRRAHGGPIGRRQMTMKEYAEIVTRESRRDDYPRTRGFQRDKVEGGVRIRIKR